MKELHNKLRLLIVIFSITGVVHSTTFDKKFEFGIASAPVHVEDGLVDIWLDFAKKGKVKAYTNQAKPDKRLEFWSKPEIEIDLAQKLGVKVFRLGVDWQRLFPNKKLDNDALAHYKNILKLIKSKNMKVMLTFFHHSEPKWTLQYGGWENPKMIEDFKTFSETIFDHLNSDVDYWLSFNEPNVYIMFTKVLGMWPSQNSSLSNFLDFPFKGAYSKSIEHMAAAHRNFYHYAHHKNPEVIVSVAQNMANYRSGGFLGGLISDHLWQKMNYLFLDLIKNELDFLGFNYYGAEYVSLTGLQFLDDVQYNDAGRAIDVKGFYKVMQKLYKRYQKPLYITENGMADSLDIMRSHYLIKHLEQIEKALKNNIPILGYIHWTLTDNFEWSDGYCPKFGLVAVERENNLKRIPRESYFVFQKIIRDMAIDKNLKEQAYTKYQKFSGKREFCRADNGQDALDRPILIPFKPIAF